MVVKIPTFRLLDVTAGNLDVVRNSEYLFAYVIEATKGPILTPTFVRSNGEAKDVFGVDFGPHFDQNPKGLLIVRVQYDGMEYNSIQYTFEEAGSYTIRRTSKGKPIEDTKVLIKKDPDYDGYRLILKLPELGEKAYKGISSLGNVFDRIQTIAGDYLEIVDDGLTAEKNDGQDYLVTATDNKLKGYFKITSEAGDGVLSGGSNGKVQTSEAGEPTVTYTYESYTPKKYVLTTSILEDSSGSNSFFVDADGTTKTSNSDAVTTFEDGKTEDDYTEVFEQKSHTETAEATYMDVGADGTLVPSQATDIDDDAKAAAAAGQKKVFEKAFRELEGEDVLGVSVLSRSPIPHDVMVTHVNSMNEEDVARIRFGITGFIPESSGKDFNMGVKNKQTPYGSAGSYVQAMSEAEAYNDPYIIYIGQGVVFKEDEYSQATYLEPWQCVQLYTGIRSHLEYQYAIFGGEDKKVLNGVKDIIPFDYNMDMNALRNTMIEMNQAGCIIFKKEYGKVTFVEGVTTSSSDVLSHESIMSIVAHVEKRLITICKPYQGQNLTEDLKATLRTALSNELRNITETDKSLISIEEYGLTPWDVDVSSAAMVRFDDKGTLIRESKIVIRTKIVPVGALRDIDLGVIVI